MSEYLAQGGSVTSSTASKYLVSVASLVVKGASSLLVTYWLANAFGAASYGLWGTIFAIGTVLSIADFGAGQLVLTTLHERTLPPEHERRLLANAVIGMVIVSAVVFVLACLITLLTDWPGLGPSAYLLYGLIVGRLWFLPAAGALAASDRYHERRAIEAAVYVVGAAFVVLGVSGGLGMSALLIGVNGLLTLGSVLTAMRASGLGLARPDWATWTWAGVRRLLADSLPYFVNNASGLAIYGGFLAFSAVVLAPEELGRLALLHNLVFMHLYQLFDVVFRTSQTRLADPVVMRRLGAGVAGSFFLAVLAALFVGEPLLRWFFPAFVYSRVELILYLSFAFAEIAYLLASFGMQMQSRFRRRVLFVSIAKLSAFLALLVLARGGTLVGYVGLLVVFSVAIAAWSGWSLREPVEGLANS